MFLLDNSFCENDKIIIVIKLLKMLLEIVQMVVPIALIILGSIDLGKAVISLDVEGTVKKSQKKFINRCIAAILVFLSALIVRVAMDFVGNDEWKECWDSVSSQKDISCSYGGSDGIFSAVTKNGKLSITSFTGAPFLSSSQMSSSLNVKDFAEDCPTSIYYWNNNGYKYSTSKKSAPNGYGIFYLDETCNYSSNDGIFSAIIKNGGLSITSFTGAPYLSSSQISSSLSVKDFEKGCPASIYYWRDNTGSYKFDTSKKSAPTGYSTFKLKDK
jgi:hypothetical protein